MPDKLSDCVSVWARVFVPPRVCAVHLSLFQGSSTLHRSRGVPPFHKGNVLFSEKRPYPANSTLSLPQLTLWGPSWPWTDWKGRVDWVQRVRSPRCVLGGVVEWRSGGRVEIGVEGCEGGAWWGGSGDLSKHQGCGVRIPARQ